MDTAKQKALIESIRELRDPSTGKALGNAASDLEIVDNTAHFAVRMVADAELRAALKAELEKVAKTFEVDGVEVEWVSTAPTRAITSEDPIPTVKNVILVMSGKGGVGKSTVATNLALTLRRQGQRVGILDADVYGPSIPTMLGIEGSPFSKDGKRIEPLERFGVKMMSVGFLLEDAKEAVIWRGPMLHGALQQFIQDVNWGELDFLIIDSPPGTGDVALTLAQKMKLTGAVIVTTPQEVALQDVYKSISMCKKLELPILGVIENMSHFVDPQGNKHEIFGSGGGKYAATFAKAPLLGSIPLDPEAREWGDRGTPISQASPTSAVSQEMIRVGEALMVAITDSAKKNPAPKPEKRLQVVR